MGFKSIKGKQVSNNKEELPPLAEPVKAGEMKKGDSVVAYYIGTSSKSNKFGGTNHNLLMQQTEDEGGQRFMIYTSGTLKYDAADGRLEKGALTRITAKGKEERENQSSGQSYMIAVFDVEQDPDDVLDLSAEEELFKSKEEKRSEKLDAIAAKVKGKKSQQQDQPAQ